MGLTQPVERGRPEKESAPPVGRLIALGGTATRSQHSNRGGDPRTAPGTRQAPARRRLPSVTAAAAKLPPGVRALTRMVSNRRNQGPRSRGAGSGQQECSPTRHCRLAVQPHNATRPTSLPVHVCSASHQVHVPAVKYRYHSKCSHRPSRGLMSTQAGERELRILHCRTLNAPRLQPCR